MQHICGSKNNKEKRKQTSTVKTRPKDPFDYISYDITGPISPQSQKGHRYFLAIISIFSNAIYAYPLTHRNSAVKAVEIFLQNVVAQHNVRYITHVRSDRAPQLYQGEMEQILTKFKVKTRSTTAPGSSWQNARAERAIRTVTITTLPCCVTEKLHYTCGQKQFYMQLSY